VERFVIPEFMFEITLHLCGDVVELASRNRRAKVGERALFPADHTDYDYEQLRKELFQFFASMDSKNGQDFNEKR
jgi:hypothetical protein